MGAIVTLEDAKEQLRFTNTQRDAQVTKLVARAEEVLLSYLGFETMADFYYEHGDTPSERMQLGVLVMVQMLYDQPLEEPLTKAVKAIVRRFRVPKVG